MITYEQIPLIKAVAKNSLESGKITHAQYQKVLRKIREVEKEHTFTIDDDSLKRINNQIINSKYLRIMN